MTLEEALDCEVYAEEGCVCVVGGGEGLSQKSSQVVLQPRLGTGHGKFLVGPLKDPKCTAWKYQYVIAGLTQMTLRAKKELQAAQTDIKRYKAPSPLCHFPCCSPYRSYLAAG